MLLLSSTIPISGQSWCGLRHGGRSGNAKLLNDPSVATKPWHMACVGCAEQVVKGDSRLGRGDAAAVSRKLYITAATFSRRGAFNMLADDNRKDRRVSIEVSNAIIG
jgi:hypothetical protein